MLNSLFTSEYASIALVALMLAAGLIFWAYQRGNRQVIQPAQAAHAGAPAGAVQASDPGHIAQLRPRDYQAQYVDAGVRHFLLDVRTPEEFRSGHIAGAVNIELDALARRLQEVPQDRPVVVYCRTGRRSAIAAQVLAQAGYAPLADLGGIVDWQRQGLPVQ